MADQEHVSREEFRLHSEMVDKWMDHDRENLKELSNLARQLSDNSIQMNEVLKQLVKSQKDHEERLDKIEAAPRDTWDKIKGAAIVVVVSSILAFLAGLFMDIRNLTGH